MFPDAACHVGGQTQAKDTEIECKYGQQIKPEYRHDGKGRRWHVGNYKMVEMRKGRYT